MNIPISKIKWQKSYRLIPSRYPPIDLFDDIASPEDWENLARAECKTNPRIRKKIADISTIPKEKRICGDGANWVMAAFTHISKNRPSRFSDGSHGVYYCANDFETALQETIFHQGRFLKATKQKAGWTTVMRELIAKIDNDFHDITSANDNNIDNIIANNKFEKELDPDSYEHSHILAKKLRNQNSNGITYPSVRRKGGQCLAVFWPNAISIPKQGSHWQYHWNGEEFDYIKKLSNNKTPTKIYKL